MELRANCKINLGLRVLRRRADGFHDIETVMVPVPGLFDTLEVTRREGVLLEVSGAGIDCPPADNICAKALELMQREFGIPGAAIRLHKAIPVGAGLGGGSSDAAFTLRALDAEYSLGLSEHELEGLAARLGSDTPLFVRNTPQLCTGRGEVMSPVGVDLAGLWLAILKPAAGVSTAAAYAGIVPREGRSTGTEAGFGRGTAAHPDAGLTLPQILRRGVGEWRGLLVNDFEAGVFALHPAIGELKRTLYDAGALYASMSGSGSAVFGIFAERPDLGPGAGGSVFVHTELLR